MYIKPQPHGTTKLKRSDRKKIYNIVAGDSFEFTTAVKLPPDYVEYANPDNCNIRFAISETKFTPIIWEGTWGSGVNLVDLESDLPPLIEFKLPDSILTKLRRGSYEFSVKLSSDGYSRTIIQGNLNIDYTPTSTTKNIWYRSDSLA